jgi:hypothetical protein
MKAKINRIKLAQYCFFALAMLLAHAAWALPLSGTYRVGANGDFSSLSKVDGLFAALNARGAQGLVIAEVISDITDEDGWVALLPMNTGAALTVRPAGGARLISGESVNALGLIAIIGADNVEINGALSASEADQSRNLTIQNTNADAVAVIEIYSDGLNGASQIRLRNLNIQGAGGRLTSGVRIGDGASLEGWDMDDYLIENCRIRYVWRGIFAQLEDPEINQRWLIQRNLIEDNSGSGIYLRAVEAPVIAANVIRNLSTLCCQSIAGIELSFDTVNASVEGNVIQNIRGSAFEWTNGISVYPWRSDARTLIVNNMVSGIFGSEREGRWANAISFSGRYPGTLQILHNSINLYAPNNPSALPAFTAGISIGEGYRGEVKYNVLRCAQPESLPALSNSSCTNVLVSIPAANALRFDQNLYQFTGQQSFPAAVRTESNGRISTLSALSNWQVDFNQDLHARVGDPRFVSDANLHLRSGSAASQLATGTSTAVDIDQEARNPTLADAGADEVSSNFLAADGFE